MQGTSRARENEKESVAGKKSVRIALPLLRQPHSLYHRISPLSSHVTAEIHRSSTCIPLPSWRGQGNQKGNEFLWRKRRKACQRSRCLRRAVVLSARCRSFTSAAAAGANLKWTCICGSLWVHVSLRVEDGGLALLTHSAARFFFEPFACFSTSNTSWRQSSGRRVMIAIGGVFMNIVDYNESIERKSFLLIPLKHSPLPWGLRLLALMSDV